MNLGDFALAAVSPTRVPGGAGGRLDVAVEAIRAEDYTDAIDLSVAPDSPLDATLSDQRLSGVDDLHSTLHLTVPAGTPSGTYRATSPARSATGRARSGSRSGSTRTDRPPRGPAVGVRAGTRFDTSSFLAPCELARGDRRDVGDPRLPGQWSVDGGAGGRPSASAAPRGRSGAGSTSATPTPCGSARATPPATGAPGAPPTRPSVGRPGRPPTLRDAAAGGSPGRRARVGRHHALREGARRLDPAHVHRPRRRDRRAARPAPWRGPGLGRRRPRPDHPPPRAQPPRAAGRVRPLLARQRLAHDPARGPRHRAPPARRPRRDRHPPVAPRPEVAIGARSAGW